MGSKTLVLDHQVVFELWLDPMFWECAPAWDADREIAEMEASAAAEEQSSLSIRHSELYNAWLNELAACSLTNPDKLQQVTDYIHRKRNYRQELIVLPRSHAGRAMVILSQGVEKCQDESD